MKRQEILQSIGESLGELEEQLVLAREAVQMVEDSGEEEFFTLLKVSSVLAQKALELSQLVLQNQRFLEESAND